MRKKLLFFVVVQKYGKSSDKKSPLFFSTFLAIFWGNKKKKTIHLAASWENKNKKLKTKTIRPFPRKLFEIFKF
jgi:hypothetical protein